MPNYTDGLHSGDIIPLSQAVREISIRDLQGCEITIHETVFTIVNVTRTLISISSGGSVNQTIYPEDYAYYHVTLK